MKKGKKYPHLWKARIGNCLVCGKEYRAVSDFKERKQKYCSLKCKEKAWVKIVRPKMRNNPGLKDEKNPAWKGDDVGYHGIHRWVIRKLGTPKKCAHCNSVSKKKYEWANKNHEYKRNLQDWMRLCTSCHRKHDIALG